MHTYNLYLYTILIQGYKLVGSSANENESHPSKLEFMNNSLTN